jgi:hypothetical protein
VTDSQDQRIQKEEQEWNAPRLLGLGFVFLAICIGLIYAMSSF